MHAKKKTACVWKLRKDITFKENGNLTTEEKGELQERERN